MNETSKAVIRRMHDARFATTYFVGDGVDIGCGPDSLGRYRHLFPLMTSVTPWDLVHGDAQAMRHVPDESFDFVNSSHCLEHLVDPRVALDNWIRITRKGGHLVVTVPDEDLYEQGVFPSTYNSDHKWTFTIAKSASWSPRSVSIAWLLGRLSDRVQVLKIGLEDRGFAYIAERCDQTQGPVAESAIEFVLRRKTDEEIARLGRLPAPGGGRPPVAGLPGARGGVRA
jgi:SAM-dependent methyltransferase